MNANAHRTDACLLHRVMRSAELDADTPPLRLLLTPWGEVESTNGSFLVDEQAVEQTLAAFRGHGTDLPIDYEHQTLGGVYASPSGQAPAAGWITNLEAEPGAGLFARIEWTEAARRLLADRQYRFLSPVAIIRREDRRLVALHSAALTNKPAIVGMPAIVNRTAAPTGVTADNSAEHMALAVPGPFSGVSNPASPALRDAPETDADRFDEPDTDGNDETPDTDDENAGEDSLTDLRTMLDLPADTRAGEVLLAARQRLAAVGAQARQEHVRRRVRAAMRAGKLLEAQRAWAEALVAREENLFDEWLKTAPVVVVTGRTMPPAEGDTTSAQTNAAARRARAEFRASPLLAGLTGEEAYVADALRNASARTG